MTAKEIKNYVDVMEHTLRRRMDSQAGKEELIKKYTEKMEQGLNAIEELEAIKLKSQAQERELRELKKSDESKERSSINYYNEMKKYKKELAELKEKVSRYITLKNRLYMAQNEAISKSELDEYVKLERTLQKEVKSDE